ncbi:hypothetical protein PtA15_5A42 [Puccinia triticina]|uniref:Fatty acid hydroxylase domain-containing protein n=1 Tax=Puccinia triticina TaxID=208348 RepID=A0ABY7CJ01_9BASI|nr:uncharacterized protein PtA15_5A42 [Puccinia triticina]WAQ84472.1 hypothetical protein PtA15_5A42 [Puccinia triticina]WAR57811.1 hypothetical protein PtB15_5B41 [Puccinia triticina]
MLVLSNKLAFPHRHPQSCSYVFKHVNTSERLESIPRPSPVDSIPAVTLWIEIYRNTPARLSPPLSQLSAPCPYKKPQDYLAGELSPGEKDETMNSQPIIQQILNTTSALLPSLQSWEQFRLENKIEQSHLYSGSNLDSLSIFEQLWLRWYLYFPNPIIATGVMSFLIHEASSPYILRPAFDKYKLQPNKMASREDQWKCIKYVLWTHFTVEIGQIWGFHPLAEYFGMATHSVPFPSISTMAYQIILFFVFEDFFHYWAHRALHTGQLYKKIHKLHHEFSAPFGLAAEYAHPLEILILGIGTIGGPLLWCVLTKGNLHILTMYIWVILRLFQAVDAHSGYDFPWSLRNILPFWSGADHHDYHHEKFVGCYSTSFRWMDHFFGTDKGYHEYRKKQKLAKLNKEKTQ